jgi:small subunit ribosomal protein S4
MGDPRKQVNKFQGPSHPWQKARIEEEKVLRREYGLRRKGDIWKATSLLKSLNNQAKQLVVATGKQADIEKKNLLSRLQRLGLLKEGSEIDGILGLGTRDILERRLQSQVCRKGLARTMKQARQFIVHEHVSVGDRKITSPGHLVTAEEEGKLVIAPTSVLVDPEHPEMNKAKVVETPAVEEETEEEVKEEKTEVKKEEAPVQEKKKSEEKVEEKTAAPEVKEESKPEEKETVEEKAVEAEKPVAQSEQSSAEPSSKAAPETKEAEVKKEVTE